MGMVEVVILLVFGLPVMGLCIGFVLCAGMMQAREDERASCAGIDEAPMDDQQIARRYRAYAAQVSNRRYVRTAGAMVRAAQ